MTRQRLFLYRAFGYTLIMVGWMGASKDAPVSSKAGKANLVQLSTQRLASQVVNKKPLTGGCHYGYYPNPNSCFRPLAA